MNKILARKVMTRDRGCILCGASSVDLHHIVFKSHGGIDDERNLVCLCRKCHETVHSDEPYWRDILLERQRGLYGCIEIDQLKKRNKWEALFNE